MARLAAIEGSYQGKSAEYYRDLIYDQKEKAVSFKKKIDESIESVIDGADSVYAFIQFQSTNGKQKFLDAFERVGSC